MVQSIKEVLTTYNIAGDILLYRDNDHRKKKLCEYIAEHVDFGNKDVCTSSDGAFGLYLARALPNKTVYTCFDTLSWDYGEEMKKVPNLVLMPKMPSQRSHKKFAEDNDYFYINQYTDDVVKNYYKEYFSVMYKAVKAFNINAFCDCGHSCATLAGFIESNIESRLVDWQFILSVNHDIKNLRHLEPYKNFIRKETFNEFDTHEIGSNIETAYPQFGNVYEATRSISAAMKWLKENPNKTVLIYVGDSLKKEGTKFR